MTTETSEAATSETPTSTVAPAWARMLATFFGAGRIQPGVCVRLWSETAHHGLAAKTEPEIRSNPAVNANKTITLAFIVLPPD